MNTNCPLCENAGDIFYQNKDRLFYKCNTCYGIYIPRELQPDKKIELARYKKHNNDTDDPGYRQFASPIISAVIQDFTKDHNGIDFGSGPDSVISKILKDKNYKIAQYDPYFQNSPGLLSKKYDFIVCCEVIEHFRQPAKEFTLLKRLLLPDSRLYCMTYIYEDSINFDKWYYKNDITHVFLYQKETIYRIKEKFGYSKVTLDNRLITFFY